MSCSQWPHGDGTVLWADGVIANISGPEGSIQISARAVLEGVRHDSKGLLPAVLPTSAQILLVSRSSRQPTVFLLIDLTSTVAVPEPCLHHKVRACRRWNRIKDLRPSHRAE